MPNGVRVDEAEHQVPGRGRAESGEQCEPQSETGRLTRRSGPVRSTRGSDLGKAEHHRIGHQAPLGEPQVAVEHAEGEAADAKEEQQPGDQLAG